MRRRLVLVVGLLLWASPGAWAALKKGPYLQLVTTTGVTVMFETDEPTPGKVILQTKGEADRTVWAESGTLHEVRVEGLTPGRRYQYAVEAGGERAVGQVATAPQGDEPFSFVVVGDTRSNADAHRVVVERVRREVPDFLLGTGDIVNQGDSERDWQAFFTLERELLRDQVLYPALGNHDRQGPRRRADAFRRYFSVPADSPDPERYYAFTYGNSRFLVLDSNSYSFALTDQTAWIQRELERAVADPAIKHVFVSMHHPPYSISLHGGQPELREMWTPLFERYGVDAVFSGHDHCYERAEKNGVHYFVSGGGGAPLYPRDPKPERLDVEATVYFERAYNYLRIQVAGDFVEVSGVREDGSLIETASWGQMSVARAPAARLAPVGAAAMVSPRARAAKACAVAAGGAAEGSAGAAGIPLVVVSWLLLSSFLARRRVRAH